MCIYILLSSEPLSCLTLADLISWFTSFSFSPAHKSLLIFVFTLEIKIGLFATKEKL